MVINSVTYGATVLAMAAGASAFRRQMSQTGLRGRQYCRLWHEYRRNHNQHYSSVTVDLATVAIIINTLSTDDVLMPPKKAAICSSPAPPPAWNGADHHRYLRRQKLHHHGCHGGTWGLTIPAADLATLPDGAQTSRPASAMSLATVPRQRMQQR